MFRFRSGESASRRFNMRTVFLMQFRVILKILRHTNRELLTKKSITTAILMHLYSCSIIFSCVTNTSQNSWTDWYIELDWPAPTCDKQNKFTVPTCNAQNNNWIAHFHECLLPEATKIGCIDFPAFVYDHQEQNVWKMPPHFTVWIRHPSALLHNKVYVAKWRGHQRTQR